MTVTPKTRMTATPRLRFVIKHLPSRTHGEGVSVETRVLQQYWYVTGTMEEYWDEWGEWRDVPLEDL
jgi:hypothetical protein